MSTRFPTVPVDVVRRNAGQDDGGPGPPVVLIVDDEPLITATLAEILRNHGLAALTAVNGQAALDIAAVIPPQMLLSDVILDGMNGFELASEITRRVPDCEVILFSGEYSTCDVVSHHSQGHEFLTLIKPVHPADMLAHVRERLCRHSWPLPEISAGPH